MLFTIKLYNFISYKHKINKQKQDKIHDYLLGDLCNFTKDKHVLFLFVVLGFELGLTSHVLPVCYTTGLHLQTHFNIFLKSSDMFSPSCPADPKHTLKPCLA